MRGLEALVRRDRTIVMWALVTVIVLSWAYILSGAGMGMSAWKMTSLDVALGRSQPMQAPEMNNGAISGAGMASGTTNGPMAAMATPARWDFGYAGVMVVMWWVMMFEDEDAVIRKA